MSLIPRERDREKGRETLKEGPINNWRDLCVVGCMARGPCSVPALDSRSLCVYIYRGDRRKLELSQTSYTLLGRIRFSLLLGKQVATGRGVM